MPTAVDNPGAGEGPDAPGTTNPSALQGLVDLVTYHDEKSLYTVLKLVPEQGFGPPAGASLFPASRVTAVGRTLDPAEGARVQLTGRWGRHPTHGVQFEFDLLKHLAPVDPVGLEKYLASKSFAGIGKALAKRIIDQLGTNALELIAGDPKALADVPGLRPSVAEDLRATVLSHERFHSTLAFLFGAGLGPVQAQAVVHRMGPDCEAQLRQEPYRLAQVPGLGFRTADRMALELGFAEDDPRRLQAALLHSLERATNDGHSFLPRQEALEATRNLLRGAGTQVEHEQAIETLCGDGLLVRDDPCDAGSPEQEALYLPYLFASEAGVARGLGRLLEGPPSTPLADMAALHRTEEAAGIELHADQRSAVLELLSNSVALLTGGPGVGKTTIIRFVTALAESAGAKVLLASPTGRAAKRLAEAAGRPASTVHRLLGFQPAGGSFERGRDRPLVADLVIVDEISMLDVVLAHHLIKAIRAPTRLVLVGDPDQLPSVGPGNVLSDLLESRLIPTARLSRIYRQADRSLIVANAHRILAGELPWFPDKGEKDLDFYMFPCEETAETAELTIEVVTQRIPQNFGLEWVTDVQVIAPMYRGECGVDVLNDRLRDAQGVGGREVVRNEQRWRVGDRVLHTRNDYEKEVFNGDMGRIESISSDGIVTVRYPEQDVVYRGAELANLRPAYAITVHRSQGGEFPAVVIPLVRQHAIMLQRNLLYTAITRAKQLVVLVGSRRALAMAIENSQQALRMSALGDRLRALKDSDGPLVSSSGEFDDGELEELT